MTEFKTAEQMAGEQKQISIAEFFEKNRHLLGFDNPAKSLLTVIKEGVDNSLDACEEAGILPDITVKVKDLGEDRFKVIIQDNGPGILKKQVPNIFGKLLYGSKFYKMQQSRGQQGIGISAAVLYSQLTTGKPTLVRSRTNPNNKVHEFHIRLDTVKNEPQIIKDVEYEKNFPDHGVYIEMEIEGKYRKGKQSVDEYIKQTALANPFSKLVYHAPDGNKLSYSRIVNKLPRRAKSILPHPHGVELGVFERMSKLTKARSIAAFLSKDFSRISFPAAKKYCKLAKVVPNTKSDSLTHQEVERLWRIIQQAKIMKPPTDCLSPIGEATLEKAIEKDLNTEFVAAITRPPAVYRGNPFGIEVCIGYGGGLAPGNTAEIVRIANRVPLLYEQSAGAINKAMKKIAWAHYKVEHKNKMPYGPMIVLVHMYSTWIPYTSESKEAIDAYPEIQKEIRLALQDCLRKVSRFMSSKRRRMLEKKRQSIFDKYIPELAYTLEKLTGEKKETLEVNLKKIIHKELKKDEKDESS
ncbi:MAG: DNA topoisomerase VI subunit B [Candidatus Aenigmarchaeota archaeon]|nr:DNA topoisomerase VI subunit B [Candidatus Aenigmarchaeota archaeon]